MKSLLYEQRCRFGELCSVPFTFHVFVVIIFENFPHNLIFLAPLFNRRFKVRFLAFHLQVILVRRFVDFALFNRRRRCLPVRLLSLLVTLQILPVTLHILPDTFHISPTTLHISSATLQVSIDTWPILLVILQISLATLHILPDTF